MGKSLSNNSGFGAVVVLAVVVTIAVIGIGGGLVYHNHHKITVAKVSTSTPAKPATSKSPATTATPPTQPAASQIMVLDCLKKSSVKPSAMVLTCADANTVAENIVWSSWAAGGATGSGDVKANDCTPNCADGHFKTYPATFNLSGVQAVGQTSYFTALDVHYSGIYPGQASTENYKLSTT